MSGGGLLSKLAPGRDVAFQDRDDFGFIHRLGNVVVHAGLDAALAVALHGVGGHGDDDVAIPRCFRAADFRSGFVAVHDRHLTVHEHQVMRSGANHFGGFFPIRGDIDSASQALKHAVEQPSD